MPYRVATFTLHNIPNSTKVLLDSVLAHYERAYKAILHALSGHTLDELRALATYGEKKDGTPRMSVEKIVKEINAKKLPAIRHALEPLESSLRESLLARIGESILSYIALSDGKHQTPSYPCPDTEEETTDAYLEALESIALLANDMELEGQYRDNLYRGKIKSSATLDFCRVEAGRNCGLFYNTETRRYYARLFLIPSSSAKGEPITLQGPFVDIRKGVVYRRQGDTRPGEQSFGRGTRSIMLPLEMGLYHETRLRYLNVAFLPYRVPQEGVEAATPKTAKLVRKRLPDGTFTYQLHVAFEVPVPKRISTEAVLGVDRGIHTLAAVSVLAQDGAVLETLCLDGLRLKALQQRAEREIKEHQQNFRSIRGSRKRSTTNEQQVHLVANAIVALAVQYKAQVVMENLSGFAKGAPRPKGQRKSNFRAQMSRRQYQALLHAIDARLELVGLPRVWTVSAAYTSLACNVCGHTDKKNRSSEDRSVFCCTQCHHSAHADVNAAVNIGRKYIHRKKPEPPLTETVVEGIVELAV